MKRKLPTILLLLAFLVGLTLMLYPTISNLWNAHHATRAIANYTEQAARLDDTEYERILEAAREYNAALSGDVTLTEEQSTQYEQLLDIGGTGIMGYIEIASLGISLPIYHGTSEPVLQVGVGHLEWTSLPVGGESTHCVLSGHRGLPSAKLLSDIDQMVVGDRFVIRVLKEKLTYEVDQIRIVLPHETEELKIAPGKDYCTLVTCTPYGINSHRLLVRGHRVESEKDQLDVHVVANSTQVQPYLVAIVVAVPLLLVMLLILFRHPGSSGRVPKDERTPKSKRRKKRRSKEHQNEHTDDDLGNP